jgi:DNA polymerase III gamma/tau subunit
MGSESALINKYRPLKFEEVIGNDLVVKSLRDAVDSQSRPHAYLFSGPSGIGKTTLARIVGLHIDAIIDEVDAATNSGIDATRAIVDLASFTPLMGSRKALVIDECHALTKPAWQALLKLVEEPPPYLYIMLATTELSKVPETIVTRCFHSVLRPCKPNEIDELLTLIAQCEGWNVDNEVMGAIIQSATGQPRKGISILQAGHACRNREELSQIVASIAAEKAPGLQLASYLMRGGRDWKMVKSLLAEIADYDEEYNTACGFLANRILDGEEGQARAAHTLLDALTFPRNGFNSKAKFVVAITSYLWNGAQ